MLPVARAAIRVSSTKPAMRWKRSTPISLRRSAGWWARWCSTAARGWRRFAMCSCWNWPNCCAPTRICEAPVPRPGHAGSGGLRDLMDALALAGQLGEETVTLNKAVRRNQSMERAAQSSSRPELALAYLRAADKVIQVDDFAP
jgi:acyl-CoA dehydrogenase